MYIVVVVFICCNLVNFTLLVNIQCTTTVTFSPDTSSNHFFQNPPRKLQYSNNIIWHEEYYVHHQFYHCKTPMILGWKVWIGLINLITHFLLWRFVGEVPNLITFNWFSLAIIDFVTLKFSYMLHCEKLPVVQQQLPCFCSTPFICSICRCPVTIFSNIQWIRNVLSGAFLFKSLKFIHVAAKNWLNLFLACALWPRFTVLYCRNKMVGHSKI